MKQDWTPTTKTRGAIRSMLTEGDSDMIQCLQSESTEMPSGSSRKAYPLYSGLMKYFPQAMMAVANCSYIGNEQHHPGTPLHWDRNKSMDQHDALMRHLMEAGTLDDDGIRHSAKVAWRALAALQLEIENESDVSD